ncbi:MAG: alpha-2-macroglobulin [Chloroflexi bacterium]|nr:alpha-2-macroglobulin [Chloroflexota bacterium]
MRYKIGVVVLAVTLLFSIMPACAPALAADAYTAVVPSVLPAGSRQMVPVALLNAGRPASGRVELSLLNEDRAVATVVERINGSGSITFDVPDVAEGEYTVRLKGEGFASEARVRVENSFLVFLETDKPIYKPGQTIHIRLLALDAELKPRSEPAIIEVMDAKGIKVFRKELTTDDYGMAKLDLPLSAEPNLGVWKINASTSRSKTQLDFRVEEYVLPKYEIKVELPKDWFLVNETIKGSVAAEYSFGKPVKGTLEVKASRYVGKWEVYSTFAKDIDGAAEFSIPAAGYVAGVPAAGGLGNVTLDFTVTESATGYEEKTSQLLTVAASSVNIQLIPSGAVFKPGLPFGFLAVTTTPDRKLVEAALDARVTYLNKDFAELKTETLVLTTTRGKAAATVNPPAGAVALRIEVSGQGAQASRLVESSYSPSGNFIHIEQLSEGTPQVGDELRFKVYSTGEAANFYYEVVARGRIVFSDFVKGSEIALQTTPAMAPSARLLVYQVLPNAEIAADYLPFKVEAGYPQGVTVEFSQPEAAPGEEVTIRVTTEGEAKVGLVAVDKSVFILAENRLNLQQVFDELERLYMKPQAELHEVSFPQTVLNRGAKEVFRDAGVVVLSSGRVPEGKEYKDERLAKGGPGGIMMDLARALPPPLIVVQAPSAAPAPGLAEVQRVRQFFPETWLWQEMMTNSRGQGSLRVTVPDSITTWMLRAVALSKNAGLGIAEAQLKAFQPFFLSVDLPYAAIRGEEFPVRVAVYNYLDEPQSVLVQLQPEAWFQVLDDTEKTIEIKPNDIGAAEFRIKPQQIGTSALKVSARSRQAADAVIKTLIIEPEGVAREIVENLSLASGASLELDTGIALSAIAGSGRAYLSVTSSYLTQTIAGLEGLLQMPFGCGEQNMIVFAPDVFITRYLQASGQLKPEVMAQAEKLMLTGYQRELTYRRSDGSFSAFGQSDKEGSLWLTSFVLKSFAQARDIIYIDDAVLAAARDWITSHQNADGSFDVIGFVTHKEMMGGLSGKPALTAYVAVALMQYGETAAAGRAVRYLEGRLGDTGDAYTLALATYALGLAGSPKAGEARDKLMKLAIEDENGLHWEAGGGPEPVPLKMAPFRPEIMPRPTADIEATAYAALALLKLGGALNASRSAKWLTSQRNAYGGYGSTQDTVVALEALTEFASGARADVDLTVDIEVAGKKQQLRVRPENFDVLQVVELPVNETVRVSARGKGEAIAQIVTRFNLPEVAPAQEILGIDVDYDAGQVAVDDLVKVSVAMTFNPPLPIEAGMVVLDVAVPTGFAAVGESIAAIREPKLKRYDISGRKVIFYIENMLPGDRVAFAFDVRALYPVKAKAVVSQAYAYYQPDIAAESLGRDITVLGQK